MYFLSPEIEIISIQTSPYIFTDSQTATSCEITVLIVPASQAYYHYIDFHEHRLLFYQVFLNKKRRLPLAFILNPKLPFSYSGLGLECFALFLFNTLLACSLQRLRRLCCPRLRRGLSFAAPLRLVLAGCAGSSPASLAPSLIEQTITC